MQWIMAGQHTVCVFSLIPSITAGELPKLLSPLINWSEFTKSLPYAGSRQITAFSKLGTFPNFSAHGHKKNLIQGTAKARNAQNSAQSRAGVRGKDAYMALAWWMSASRALRGPLSGSCRPSSPRCAMDRPPPPPKNPNSCRHPTPIDCASFLPSPCGRGRKLGAFRRVGEESKGEGSRKW